MYGNAAANHKSGKQQNIMGQTEYIQMVLLIYVQVRFLPQNFVKRITIIIIIILFFLFVAFV